MKPLFASTLVLLLSGCFAPFGVLHLTTMGVTAADLVYDAGKEKRARHHE